MDADVKPDILEAVVKRAASRCCICGRPCGRNDVWRHTEAGPFGDTPENFSAMCPDCVVAQVTKGAAPARYIVHTGPADDGRRGERLRRKAKLVMRYGALALACLTLASYGGMAGWLLYASRKSIFDLMCAAGLLAALYLLTCMIVGFWRGLRGLPAEPTQRVHHTFDEQSVTIREAR
jgi:hypothetical protein